MTDHSTTIPLVVTDPELAPTYATPGDAGADLCSAEQYMIFPGETVPLRTGVSIALPPGHVGFITPRSGLARNEGLTVLNAPGTIDSGYRGEIIVLMHNTSDSRSRVNRGDRIAQLVIVPFVRAEFAVTDSLDDTVRGAGGFGSTGR